MSTLQSQQYIIAIGASAGGMQEINSFFDHTPLDGVSYVIIQHLSATYKSLMASLLPKHSKLKVCEAKNNMVVEKNNVYLIPSKDYMTINDGKLFLTEKQKTNTPHLTIDTFFNSLALDIGNKAIGVILSGTGHDGTKGAEAIKNAGGMVIASDPAKAEYGEMPMNAINTGLVDYVVEPEQMPVIIENYVNDKQDTASNVADNEREEKWRIAIIDFMKDHFPHDFSNYKQATILRRIKRRAAYKNMNNLQVYYDYLKVTPDEVNDLSQDFLISVTAFFRDKDAFDILQTNVIPEIINKKPNNEELKIWVAGCATGEEAYSLAILIKEELIKVNKNIVVKIFATDIDNIALSYAKNGFYDENTVKALSPERLELFFTKENGVYKVNQSIRKMLIFANHDLVKNPPYCNMDLISCRNLLIYMNQTLQKKVYAMLQFGLKNGGYLFLGPSENLAEKTPDIDEVNAKWKIYKNINTKHSINFEYLTSPIIAETKAIPLPSILINEFKGKKDSLTETLLSELGYAGVSVDSNNHVLQTFGNLSKYLLNKMFHLNITDVLPKPLAIAFKNASHEALKTKKTVAVKDIKIKYNNAVIITNLTVIPLNIKKADENIMLVLFNEVNSPDVTNKDTKNFNEKIYESEYITNLEEELRQVKEDMQNVLEKLDASNENMQSFNEELLSTNEEMQSTNEEMQSVNEELNSINAEYQLKIKELSDINDDLNNYFRSNVNGQLFVNKDLLLMKFSPGAVKHINLLDTDIGRPITNISTNIRNEILEEDAKEIIANGGVITKEVQAINGKWYQMMTMPYVRQKGDVIDGAMITFNDITELKKVQTELDKTNRTLTAINADLDNFVYAASHDLLGPLNNIEQIITILGERKEEVDNEVSEYHRMLLSAVSNFKALVKDLAVVGKIESEIYEGGPINLNKIIDDIKLSIKGTIHSTNATIYTNLNVAEIRFSKKNLRSILYNLISNAVKFRSHERDIQIHISTSFQEGFVLLCVQDNGLGIEKEQIANIFHKYKRINENIDGQGIGLYLIKKIVDASGGKIIVESEVGNGSTFKLYFKV